MANTARLAAPVGAEEAEAPTRIARVREFCLSRPATAVFLAALVARFAVAVVVFATSGGTLFLDDESYASLAADAASGADRAWDPYLDWLYTRTGVLLWPVTGLYEVFGPVVLVGQSYVALLGATAAAMTTLVAREVVPTRWALLAGGIVALLPSQVLWSSLILKDAAVWAMLAGLAVVAARMHCAAGRRLVAWAGVAALLFLALAYLRLHTMEVALIAFFVAALVGPRAGRTQRAALAGGILMFLPLLFGMGLAGSTFVANAGSLEDRRLNNAAGAVSAIVDTPPAVKPSPEPSGAGTGAGVNGPAKAGSGSGVDDPATVAPAAEEEVIGPASSGVWGNVRYLPSGLAAAGLRPYPWETRGSESVALKLAGIEAFAWYALLLVALVGLVMVVRQRARAMVFPLLVLGGTWFMYALTEGNLGTAFRHRGEFVWPVAVLVAAGSPQILTWWRRRMARDTRS